MHFTSVRIVYFSATGTTKKIVRAIGSAFNETECRFTDITKPDSRQTPFGEVNEDLLVLALPVYEERIPLFLTKYLTSLKGTGQPAVVVGVYGNVGYGIILSEMQALLNQNGFITIAGAAFIGEHSFSHSNLPIAVGRPDSSDLSLAAQFGKEIKNKLEFFPVKGFDETKKLPGTLPFMARILPQNSSRFFADIPQLNPVDCNHCGVCVKKCPVSAINPETFLTNDASCCRCFACVRCCPQKARSIKLKIKPIVKRFFKKNQMEYKQPIWFIP